MTRNQGGLHVAFFIILGLFAAGTVYTLIRTMRGTGSERQLSGDAKTSLLAVAVFTLVYPAITLVSMSYVDASTILDHRLMIPFYMSVLILLMFGLAWLFTHYGVIWKISTLLVVLVAAGWVGYEGWQEVKQLSLSGLGFNSLGVTASPTIRYIEQMPPGIIYSNRAYLVYIITDRLAYMLTGTSDPVTGSERVFAKEEVVSMREAVLAGKAYLVYFKDEGYATDPWYLVLSEGLRPIEEFSDGIIFMGSQ